jgi:hypothetical protein
MMVESECDVRERVYVVVLHVPAALRNGALRALASTSKVVAGWQSVVSVSSFRVQTALIRQVWGETRNRW